MPVTRRPARPSLSGLIILCIAAGMIGATASIQALSDQSQASVRAGETTTALADGRMLVVGAAQMARVQPALTVRADGIVQIVGGDQANSIEYYDPATQTFGPDPVAA